jgi:hypothetical protein
MPFLFTTSLYSAINIDLENDTALPPYIISLKPYFLILLRLVQAS